MLPLAIALVNADGRIGEEQLLVMDETDRTMVLKAPPSSSLLHFQSCAASKRRSCCAWISH